MVTEQRLLFPGLAGFYTSVDEIAYTCMRVVVGVMFLMHVWGKFNIGAGRGRRRTSWPRTASEPGTDVGLCGHGAGVIGGICLIIGLFTRFFAAALAIEMLIALIVVHLPKGYAVGAGGYEYVLLIGAVCS